MVWSAACVLVFALSLSACVRGERHAPDFIKLVSSLPRSGSANQQTTPMVHGIRMALDEAQGKAGRFHVIHEDWDDASTKKGDWDPEVEAANADRAVQDTDIMVYLGPYNSGAAKISMPVLNRANLAMISVATYPGLSKPDMGEPSEPAVYRPTGSINFFRITPADDVQGSLAASWVRDMGGQQLYVVDDQSLYGRGLAEVFAATAEDLGLQVLGHESMDPKAQEYRSLMARIGVLKPDWLYFGGSTQTNAGQIIKDLVGSGMHAKLMVPDACMDDALIDAAGAASANGRVFATFGGMPPQQLTAAGARFVAQYAARFGGVPESYAVYGYVSAQAALAAIAYADRKDREAIRLGLFAIQQPDSALGGFGFGPTGDTTLQGISGYAVRDAHFQFARPLRLP